MPDRSAADGGPLVPAQERPARRSGAESSRKVLQLLRAFSPQRHTRSAAELGAALEMPISSIYRYLSVLREEGLVEEARPGEYRLSWLFVSLAGAARAAGDSLDVLAKPVLRSMAEASGETSLLIKRVGWSAICVDRVESPHPVRLQFDQGQPMILHQGSASRVLLASMKEAERERYLAAMSVLTDSEREQIRADVALVARVGWLESFGEVDEGIWGASAVIKDGAEAIGALGVAGPLFRLQHADRARIIELVISGAAEISRILVDRSHNG